ncbi:MAG: NUDIX domain-containing protein [Gemmatimonadaceae bacterium]|nr:NUDIX domain-containing protein [Gemmatimonadaceae bacterium]
MPARTPSARRVSPTIDVVIITPRGRRLMVLLVRAPAKSRERWQLPWRPLRPQETIDDEAARLARKTLGVPPSLVEQAAAFGDRKRHPSGAELSVAFLALIDEERGAAIESEATWHAVDELPPLPPRQRSMLEGVLASLRARLDQAPIAFHLLPSIFTLTQLQEIYELLLGRRLHKASFRRSLHAAWLVEPTDEWRSEGRGRPAQLFRYAPKKRRGGRRGVRFGQ